MDAKVILTVNDHRYVVMWDLRRYVVVMDWGLWMEFRWNDMNEDRCVCHCRMIIMGMRRIGERERERVENRVGRNIFGEVGRKC